MTGAPIDASLRGTETPEQVQGAEVPDSKTNLAASPQLIMSPGVSRPVFKFADGAGLTDAFGNIYDGYGGGGGSSFIHKDTPAASVGDQADGAADGEFMVFDDVLSQYVPRTFRAFGSVLIETPTNKVYKLIRGAPYDLTITATEFFFGTGPGTVVFPAGPILSGADLDVTVSGTTGASADLSLRIDYTINLLDM